MRRALHLDPLDVRRRAHSSLSLPAILQSPSTSHLISSHRPRIAISAIATFISRFLLSSTSIRPIEQPASGNIALFSFLLAPAYLYALSLHSHLPMPDHSPTLVLPYPFILSVSRFQNAKSCASLSTCPSRVINACKLPRGYSVSHRQIHRSLRLCVLDLA